MSNQKPSLENGSPKHCPDPKSLASVVKCEVHVDSFFYFEGVHHAFLLHGQDCQQTVLSARGSEKTKARFMEGKKRMLHHENTPTHSLPICDFLPQYKTTLTPQTPYLPDQSCTNRLLFVSQAAIYTEG